MSIAAGKITPGKFIDAVEALALERASARITQTYRIPLSASTWDDREASAIARVVQSGFVTMGREVARFEEAFAALVGARHAIMVTSGSAALLLAAAWYRNLRGPGQYITAPAVTWPTTITPFLLLGFNAYLQDIDPETLVLRAPNTKHAAADIPVHLMGNRAPVHGVACQIEDSCELLDGKPIAGAIACFSFYFSHHISTGEGGALATNDDRIADELRSLRSHGWTRGTSESFQREALALAGDIDERFLFRLLGFNCKPTELQAAAGIEQLKKLAVFNARRRELWARLRALIPPPLATMQPTTPDIVPFALPLLAPTRAVRDSLRAHLEGWHIETRPIAGGNLARQPAFARCERVRTNGALPGALPGAQRVHDCGLFIGLHPMLSDSDVQYIGDALGAFGRAQA